MKKILLIPCLLLAMLQARADFVSISTVESAGKTLNTTLKFKGNKSLLDIDGKVSISTDLTTGDSIVLYHSAKKFKKLSLAEMNAKRKAELQGNAPDPTSQPRIVDTGKSEKVGAYNTEIYTADTPAARFTFWITKDYPDYARVNGELKAYRALENKLTGNLYPDFSKNEGVTVKFTVVLSSGKTTTTTLVSAREQPVDDAEFQIPADYTEFQQVADPGAPTPTTPSPASPAPASPAPAP